MSLPKRFLGENENVFFELRTHVKRVLDNLSYGLLIVAAGIVGSVLMPEAGQPIGSYLIWGVVVVALIPTTVVPVVKWWFSTYTVTDRRIITRTGVLNKKGHDIPLARISNVEYEHSFFDRLFRCGTLILQTSASESLRLDDLPHVERVHVTITEMLFNRDQQRSNDH
ncbi:MAG: PH domain-containing protein [Galactobacter sp.]